MTVAEVVRESKGIAYRKEQSNKEVANMVWLLPQLIGASIGTMFDKNAKYPEIEQVFPTLFENDPEVEKRKRMERSAAQLIQFANSHNMKMKERELENE